MIVLSDGRKKWQVKARKLGLACHCWPCLRAAGITPHITSHESHRRNILPNSPIYRTDNGRAGKTTDA